MRTRLLPILCVLALLLSACTVDGKPSAATASVPVSGPTDETAAPTAPPTESAPDPSGSPKTRTAGSIPIIPTPSMRISGTVRAGPAATTPASWTKRGPS